MKRLLILVTFLFTLVGGVVLYAATHITTTGTAPAVCNVGDIFMKTGASAGFYRCSAANTWTRLPDVGGTDFAPTNAQYWTGAADGTLSAEKNLGALSTGLVINTAGVPSAYGGSSCAASNFVSSVDASGVVTCSVPSGTGAPTTATYITQTPDGTLSAEQALSALSTGIMKVTTATGVVSSLAIPLTVANGGTGIASGTDGGVLAFAGSTTTIVSSGALTANLPVIGGGAGAAPTVGTRSGNTTRYVTMDASTPATNDCVKFDANLNITTAGAACGSGGGSTSLDAITAAAAATSTRASGNNYEQIFNWALTTAAKQAIIFGETTAATNGGTAASTSQAILSAKTLATSTAIPLYVINAGGAPSLRVDDVASDTTPFCVDSGGSVQINGNSTGTSGCSPTSNLDIQGSNGSYTTYWYDGTDTMGIFSDTNKAGIGTKSTHMFSLFANNSNPRLAVHTGGSINLFRRQSAVTSLSTGTTGHDQYYLNVGSDEFGSNAYFLIGYGYDGTTNCDVCGTPPPVFAGMKMTTTSGNTKGDFVIGTRAVTTDTAASIRLQITSNGGVWAPSTTPTPTVSNTSANSCGTTAATIAGNSFVGEITVGATSGTSCTLTFADTAPVKWLCFGTNTTTTANLVTGIPVSTTTAKLDGTFVGGDVIAYMCVAR